MTSNVVRFMAILFCALALVPTGAHLLELLNKLALHADEYLTAQRLYRGWSLSGVLVYAALLSTLALAWVLRRRPGFAAALVALACIAATQIIFWSVTYPTNVATNNWTLLPQDWQALRVRWEFSHAASALLNLGALIAATLAVLSEEGPTCTSNGPRHGMPRRAAASAAGQVSDANQQEPRTS